MMFDKELFFSLCEKYGVEMSTTAIHPMIKDREEVHIITDDDISKIFSPYKTYFEYSNNKANTKLKKSIFYLQEEYTIAC